VRARINLLPFLFIIAACGGSTTAGPAADAGDASVTSPADANEAAVSADVAQPNVDAAEACVATSDSTLSVAHITLDSSRCVFTIAEAKAGIAIGYDVVVDAPGPGVVPRPQDAGYCGAPDGSRLIPFEYLSGNNQTYCQCDTGLCMTPPNTPIALVPGTYHHTFDWDGTNWMGPSDTGQPHGTAFPPGMYTLRVSAVGATGDGGTFFVEATLPITLVP
jgi:hypothetical protein